MKAVIFDLDDTLISENDYIKSGYCHIAKLFETYCGIDERDIYHILWDLYKIGSDKVFNRLFDRLDMSYDQSDIKKLVQEYRGHLPEISFYGDVWSCLEMLKDKKMSTGMITDGYAVSQTQKLLSLNAYHYFDNIIMTDELGKKFWKPHPKAFKMMRDFFNADYNQMVYIGDNLTKDFIAPNKLGMTSIRIHRENGVHHTKTQLYGKAFQPAYSIKTLRELIDVLD